MALKRQNKIDANFSMASMTDIIFLLLLFFMITSTVVNPNSIKILLPESKQQSSAKPLTRVIIDKNLNYYVAFGNEKEQQVPFEGIETFLQAKILEEPDMYVALYADESIPYRELVRVLNICNENKFKLVLATRPPEK
ncbi:MAG: biopolymer transporter ExbD [Bacteroidales bacterium]|jgi:biopolymer transport protein ExbD|nr:biopolymer transporter ExbD [Bacteroidales bacterium]MDD2611751.1 biopolymer transporter ExbD [Bacteroidales bacterium]MDD3906783.1 biopolymer transporter ExbD [Bacteroidales bacterium]MDD4712086.1 biopolymer transporter ExbD [Bacteroidales bacterium]